MEQFFKRYSDVFRLVNAILLPCLSLLISLLLHSATATSPFPLFMAAVAISAWQGGFAASVLTAFISAFMADFFITEPRYTFTTDVVGWLQIFLFLVAALLISWIEYLRRKSEQAMYASNEQLKIILDNIADGISVQQPNREFLFVNPAAAQLLGFPSVEAMAMTPITYFRDHFKFMDEHDEPIPFHRMPGQRSFEAKSPQEQAVHLVNHEMNVDHWMVIKSVPVLDEVGNIKLVVNIFRDESLQKQREVEQNRLAAIVENSGDAIISKSLEGIILTWNPAAEQIYGYSAAEMIGQPMSLLYPEAIREHEMRLRSRVQNGERITNYETLRLRKDGSQIDISITISPITNRRGDITAFSTVEHDISMRRSLERLQLENQLRLRNLINNLPLPILQLNLEGRVIEANPMAAEIGGMGLASVIGKPLETLYEWEEPFYIQHAIALALEGQVTNRDTTIKRADDSITLALMIAPVLEEDKVVRYLIVSGMDITQRRQTTEAMAQFTRELARSNEELQQFAYIASHDLQEPLRAISSYLGLLESRYSQQLDQDAKEFIGFAVDGASRMSKLIKALLTYSRVQSKPLEAVPVDCQQVLDKALANLQVAIEDNKAQITHSTMPKVQGDEAQLTQVLQNLIGNAIKFHGEEAPKIHVEAKQEGATWVFSVQDNGIGIDNQYLDRIFLIFQRLHNRRDYEGTGIGLAVCQRIVERHGGRIWVESEVGKGTCFYFTIPPYQHIRKTQ